MEFRKGEEEEIENIAALLILNVQALFKLGILDICLSVSKQGRDRSPFLVQSLLTLVWL